VKYAGHFVSLPAMDSKPMTTAHSASEPLQCGQASWFGLKPIELIAMLAVSFLVLLATYRNWWSIGVTEGWGFVTGGICVWLVVREHLWNWPIGLANNLFFLVLFFRGRLYADMSLQIVYLGLGIYGWLNWMFGGQNHSVLKISHTSRTEWITLAAAIPFATWGMRIVLLSVNDAAPFLDALTTVLSLAAQYLLCRKRFENWWLWIVADLIYVPLYFSRKLPLTAVLYALFLAMCLIGVREWSRTLKKGAGVR
jgi:nicotinamide mononucleotide transporter